MVRANLLYLLLLFPRVDAGTVLPALRVNSARHSILAVVARFASQVKLAGLLMAAEQIVCPVPHQYSMVMIAFVTTMPGAVTGPVVVVISASKAGSTLNVPDVILTTLDQQVLVRFDVLPTKESLRNIVEVVSYLHLLWFQFHIYQCLPLFPALVLLTQTLAYILSG